MDGDPGDNADAAVVSTTVAATTTWTPPVEAYVQYTIVPDPEWERAQTFLQNHGI